MRHTTKIKEKTEMWDALGYSFDADFFRAKLDSNQVTVRIDQFNDDDQKLWFKSFRGNTPIEADALANEYVLKVKKNSLEAEEEMRYEQG